MPRRARALDDAARDPRGRRRLDRPRRRRSCAAPIPPATSGWLRNPEAAGFSAAVNRGARARHRRSAAAPQQRRRGHRGRRSRDPRGLRSGGRRRRSRQSRAALGRRRGAPASIPDGRPQWSGGALPDACSGSSRSRAGSAAARARACAHRRRRAASPAAPSTGRPAPRWRSPAPPATAVGPFDESYRHYAQDLDYCQRLAAAGRSVRGPRRLDRGPPPRRFGRPPRRSRPSSARAAERAAGAARLRRAAARSALARPAALGATAPQPCLGAAGPPRLLLAVACASAGCGDAAPLPRFRSARRGGSAAGDSASRRRAALSEPQHARRRARPLRRDRHRRFMAFAFPYWDLTLGARAARAAGALPPLAHRLRLDDAAAAADDGRAAHRLQHRLPLRRRQLPGLRPRRACCSGTSSRRASSRR